MTAEQNGSLPPEEQDTVMVYFNPELIQSLADLSNQRQRNFRELQEAARDGDLDAACQLGQHYCRGSDGAPKDEKEGFFWLSKAAEGDHIAAQYSLGMCARRKTRRRVRSSSPARRSRGTSLPSVSWDCAMSWARAWRWIK